MNFTTRQAKSMVIGATAGAAILASLVQLSEGSAPDIRVGVGAVIAGGLMFALADVAPSLAGSLALVLLVGAALQNGTKVAAIVAGATNGGK